MGRMRVKFIPVTSSEIKKLCIKQCLKKVSNQALMLLMCISCVAVVKLFYNELTENFEMITTVINPILLILFQILLIAGVFIGVIFTIYRWLQANKTLLIYLLICDDPLLAKDLYRRFDEKLRTIKGCDEILDIDYVEDKLLFKLLVQGKEEIVRFKVKLLTKSDIDMPTIKFKNNDEVIIRILNQDKKLLDDKTSLEFDKNEAKNWIVD